MKKDFMFTSESVTEGHPDKICDQISDAVLDHFLEQDPYARVRAECAISTSILFIAARFASEVRADIPTLAREVTAKLAIGDPISMRRLAVSSPAYRNIHLRRIYILTKKICPTRR